ncbi:capsular polysaccharide export protein, LipB/KpsS family [Chitinophaga agri]|uniref:Capsular biosynthesis protein n=1 Tax=Chitinophaga agri TaxID=2703787 RepID=A0A6B9Z8E1_9BACT|nr:hypothetical protein [Chitinophaga agri]QHS58236.1 hypothetical protein GWR21_01090 [Chitinophaga agri]
MSAFLILINNAPQMPVYHTKLGEALEQRGHQVYYAYSDHLPFLTDHISPEGKKVFVFSSYFREHYKTAVVPEKYRGINLWETFYADYDRFFVNYRFKPRGHGYYEALMANMVSFFDDIFTTCSIDYFIYENISNSFAHVCYQVGALNNVGFLGYCVSRMPGRFEIQTERFNTVQLFSHAYDNVEMSEVPESVMKDIDTYLDRYEEDKIPTYHSFSHPLSYKTSLIKKYVSGEKVRMFTSGFKYLRKYGADVKYSFPVHNPVKMYTHFFFRQLNRKLKIFRSRWIFDKVKPEGNYFVFPMQMKPESSTSVWARHFVDEISLIKNIAFNLPFGTLLYVKEHFVNLGNLPFEVYQELKRIPNVRLVHPLEPNKPLLQHSLGIITLTSTMGFEALMMGKMVVAFGDIFYKKHPLCISVKSFEDLYTIFSAIKKDNGKVRDINRRFLAAYYNCTYEGNVNYIAYGSFDPERFTVPMVQAISAITARKQTEVVREEDTLDVVNV